jgi:hypothetical protein
MTYKQVFVNCFFMSSSIFMLSDRQISQPCDTVWRSTVEIFRIGHISLILQICNLVPQRSRQKVCWRRSRQCQSVGVYLLAVASAAARTVRGSGLDGPRPRRRSVTFTALHQTVCDGAGSSYSLLESRSRPWGRDLRVFLVDMSPEASPNDMKSTRN